MEKRLDAGPNVCSFSTYSCNRNKTKHIEQYYHQSVPTKRIKYSFVASDFDSHSYFSNRCNLRVTPNITEEWREYLVYNVHSSSISTREYVLFARTKKRVNLSSVEKQKAKREQEFSPRTHSGYISSILYPIPLLAIHLN